MKEKKIKRGPGRPKGSKNKRTKIVKPTKAQLKGTLSKRFVPEFLDYADTRVKAIRILRENLAVLKEHADCDSFQKELIAKRATFLACRLETLEVQCATGNEDIELGVYTQMTNALVGLLKCLGLERQRKQVQSLETYVKTKTKRRKTG